MSTILTETSTFSATVTVPDDGDPGAAASVVSGMQSLTNRTLYLNDNKRGVPAYAAQFSFNSGAVAAGGTVVPITQDFSFPSGDWGISSNVITVPVVGVYLVSAKLSASNGSAVDNVLCEIFMEVATSQFGSIVGYRPGTDTSDSARMTGESTVIIGNTATDTLRFTQQSSGVLTIGSVAYTRTIVITYLGTST